MRRAAFPAQGVIRSCDTVFSTVVVRAGGGVDGASRERPHGRAAIAGSCHCQSHGPAGSRAVAGGRPIAGWAAMLRFPSKSGITDFNVPDEVESCLALARSTQSLVAMGDRLAAARAAVELVKAYDRVLENARLVARSLPEQQRVRDRLTPVAEMLRKYRLR